MAWDGCPHQALEAAQRLPHGHYIFRWHVRLNVVHRAKHTSLIASRRTHITSDVIAHLVRPAMWQDLLGRDATSPEHPCVTKITLERHRLHPRGPDMYRLEDVDADLDQVGEQLRNAAANAEEQTSLGDQFLNAGEYSQPCIAGTCPFFQYRKKIPPVQPAELQHSASASTLTGLVPRGHTLTANALWPDAIERLCQSHREVSVSRVVIVGDSIRIGYQDIVRRELKDTAEVWGPNQNGGNSANILGHLDEWVITRQPDLVHLNCGLHDIKRPFGADENAIPAADYERNLDRILARLLDETRAKVILATTTPVNEKWHHENKSFDRFEADVITCNQIARRVADARQVVINDLYAMVMEKGRDSILLPDGVHYCPEGYEILGRAVAEAIRAGLGVSGEESHACDDRW